MSEALQRKLAERRAQKAEQERILEEERQRYAREKELFDALPRPIGLEDIDPKDIVAPHRYEKYVEGVLRKMAADLTSGHYRDNTTFECSIALIELAAAHWNDFTIQDAQRFLRTYAPKRGRPYGGQDDLPANFLEIKWKSAVQTWRSKGSQARERPASNTFI